MKEQKKKFRNGHRREKNQNNEQKQVNVINIILKVLQFNQIKCWPIFIT